VKSYEGFQSPSTAAINQKIALNYAFSIKGNTDESFY